MTIWLELENVLQLIGVVLTAAINDSVQTAIGHKKLTDGTALVKRSLS